MLPLLRVCNKISSFSQIMSTVADSEIAIESWHFSVFVVMITFLESYSRKRLTESRIYVLFYSSPESMLRICTLSGILVQNSQEEKKKNCQEKQTSKNFRGYVQKISYFIKPELL